MSHVFAAQPAKVGEFGQWPKNSSHFANCRFHQHDIQQAFSHAIDRGDLTLQFVIEVRQHFQGLDRVGDFGGLAVQRVLNFDELIQVAFGRIQTGFGGQRVTQSEESFGIGEGGFGIATF